MTRNINEVKPGSAADRIKELEAENKTLREILRDIDGGTIWEAGATVPDRSMQERIEAALEQGESE